MLSTVSTALSTGKTKAFSRRTRNFISSKTAQRTRFILNLSCEVYDRPWSPTHLWYAFYIRSNAYYGIWYDFQCNSHNLFILTMHFFSVLLLSLIAKASAVLHGDEGYADLDGKFYAFYSGGVAIIDPETCEIDKTITQDAAGQPLPTGWYDGIYMQLYPEDNDSGRRLHEGHDHGDDNLKGYVLINSRDDRENDVGDPVADVYIFNTAEATVESIVEVGHRAVHSYGIHNRYVRICVHGCRQGLKRDSLLFCSNQNSFFYRNAETSSGLTAMAMAIST